jgi:DNA modification methylase
MELDKIITGDSAVVLQSFPPDCIDLTVTSPPYDNLRTYNGFTFDFETIARQLFRVTKAGGVVVWVVGDATVNGSESGTSFKQALFFKECGFNLHDTMIYQRSSPPLTHNRYEQHFEYMFVFSKGSPKTFNPIKTKKEYPDKRLFKTIRREKDGSSDVGFVGKQPDKIIGNVWYIKAGGGHSASDNFAHDHPAIFPEQLASDHIQSWSNEGDTILDCFCGSGTTPKMAKMLSRQYIGIEISPEYVTLAEKRLLATNVPLFGQGRGLTLPAPDGGDSAPSQALSTPDMFSAIEHEPAPAPRR